MSDSQFPPSIQGTSISTEYTVILRQGYLEFYETGKGPWEKRDVPDFLLRPEEVDGLEQFLIAVRTTPPTPGIMLNSEEIPNA